MRSTTLTLIAAVIAFLTTADAAEVSSEHIEFGNHAKIDGARSERDKITTFYEKALGCKVVRRSERMDIVQFPNRYYLVIVYGDSAPPASDTAKFLFQAPDGQVYRVVRQGEDLAASDN